MEQSERTYHNTLINRLRPHIMHAKKELGITTCERCGRSDRLEINHKRYGEDITLYDLELLCISCHSEQTGWARDMARIGSYCPYCQHSY
jgi:hypothetical protein